MSRVYQSPSPRLLRMKSTLAIADSASAAALGRLVAQQARNHRKVELRVIAVRRQGRVHDEPFHVGMELKHPKAHDAVLHQGPEDASLHAEHLGRGLRARHARPCRA